MATGLTLLGQPEVAAPVAAGAKGLGGLETALTVSSAANDPTTENKNSVMGEIGGAVTGGIFEALGPPSPGTDAIISGIAEGFAEVGALLTEAEAEDIQRISQSGSSIPKNTESATPQKIPELSCP